MIKIPQMSSMDWLFLSMYFLFIYWLFMVMFYYLIKFSFNRSELNLNNISFSFYW